MSARLHLRNFAVPDAAPEPPLFTEEDMAAARASAYAEGFAVGQAEAEGRLAAEQARLTEEIRQGLQDLAFGYHEARVHLLGTLEPLFRQITGTLLPEIARAALPDMLQASLTELAAEAAGAPVTIEVSPQDRAALEPVLAGSAFPLMLQVRSDLAPGQILVGCPDGGGHAIDMGAAIEALSRSITAFFTLSTETRAHG